VGGALYSSVGLVVLPETTEWEDGAFVAIAELTGGKWLGNWMGLAGAVSATGLLCTLLCTSSRQLAGMASTGAVNKIFAAKHSVYGTPYISIILVGTLAFAFTGFDFSMLAEADMFFYTASTILKFGALVRWGAVQVESSRPMA
jgi:amino acid transporter